MLKGLGEAIKARGHKLTVAFPLYRDWFQELTDVATVIEFPELRNPVRSGFPGKLERICRENLVDLIHMHFSFALPFSLALPFQPETPPVVFHWHNLPKVLQKKSEKKFLTPRALLEQGYYNLCEFSARMTDYRIIDLHIAISDEIEDILLKNKWTTPAKILKLANASKIVPDESLQINSSPRSEEITIGSVANFRQQKDHRTLLQAFKSVSLKHPECKLVLVGDGPTKDQMKDLASELGLGDRVMFVGEVNDTGQYYRQFDIFALSSHYEGHSLVILEAMNYAIPIVATNVGGVPNTVNDGVEGFLVSPQSPEKFSEALEKLIENPSLRISMGKAGRKKVIDVYSIDKWAEKLLYAYDRVLATSR